MHLTVFLLSILQHNTKGTTDSAKINHYDKSNVWGLSCRPKVRIREKVRIRVRVVEMPRSDKFGLSEFFLNILEYFGIFWETCISKICLQTGRHVTCVNIMDYYLDRGF